MYFDTMLLPQQKDCKAMFYHVAPADAAVSGEKGLFLKAGGSVSFDAYYNLFPLCTYREFTVCSDPVLRLQLKGCGTAELIACDSEGNVLAEERADFSAEDGTELCLSMMEIPPEAAVLYWRCEAQTDCLLTQAHLTFPEPPQREITLAVGICTYRREEFVCANARQITALFAQEPDAAHHLFISDNGGTLGEVLQNSERMTVYQNPNTGGSGGFARVMREAMHSETAFTHLLLMDDDLYFRPEILQRMICFLSYCREEYRHVTVGGAMCLLDRPWMQFEAGAHFLKGGELRGLQMGLDLREAVQCIRNAAAPQEADYQSWWCCCMSMERIRKAGLPMPFFIKMDDVEYALRLGQKTVCLPGVCVAHEDFDKKYNPALEYYIVRNTLITCALHKKDVGIFRRIGRMYAAVLRNAMLQRYDSAALVLRAHRDFLRGAKFLRKTDPALLHQKILESAPKTEQSQDFSKPTERILVPRWMRMLTFNGLLLPSIRENVSVDMQHAVTADAYRARSLIHVNVHTGMQYKTRLRRGRVWCLFWRAFLTGFLMLCRYGLARYSYRAKRVYLRGEQFWGKCNGKTQENA